MDEAHCLDPARTGVVETREDLDLGIGGQGLLLDLQTVARGDVDDLDVCAHDVPPTSEGPFQRIDPGVRVSRGTIPGCVTVSSSSLTSTSMSRSRNRGSAKTSAMSLTFDVGTLCSSRIRPSSSASRTAAQSAMSASSSSWWTPRAWW